MKCPECENRHRRKYGRQCGSCGYIFAFGPTDRSFLGMTDAKFLGHVRAASRNGTTYFTENQLYGAYCRRVKTKIRPDHLFLMVSVFAGLGFLVMFSFAMGAPGGPCAIFILILFGLIAGVLVLFARPEIPPPRQIAAVLCHWQESGKTIEHLLDEPSLHETPPEWTEPDIYDYGVERLLVVEHDLMVDLFVRNNQHAEQRMLVIAESGYPEYLLPHVRRLLEENPALPDCSATTPKKDREGSASGYGCLSRWKHGGASLWSGNRRSARPSRSQCATGFANGTHSSAVCRKFV